MVIIRTAYQITAKFTDHLIVPDLAIYPIKFLLLQTIIIEVSLYCDKLANFSSNTHSLSYIYCHLAVSSNSILNKNGQMTIHIHSSSLCVFVPKFANLSQ